MRGRWRALVWSRCNDRRAPPRHAPATAQPARIWPISRRASTRSSTRSSRMHRIVIRTAVLVAVAQSPLVAQVASVEVTPAAATVQAGAKQQFRAVARDARGTALKVPVTWLATPFAIAAADSTG